MVCFTLSLVSYSLSIYYILCAIELWYILRFCGVSCCFYGLVSHVCLMSVIFISFFFFNDPATTEIYTYLLTLSLHGALPICRGVPEPPCPPRGRDPAIAVARVLLRRWRRFRRIVPAASRRSGSAKRRQPRASGCAHVTPGPSFRRARSERSEEHTSELQSLMRLSYAVFCLKKKKVKYQTKQDHDDIYYNGKSQL